jgi:hypothetical protein
MEYMIFLLSRLLSTLGLTRSSGGESVDRTIALVFKTENM